jgi:hypothetical protein
MADVFNLAGTWTTTPASGSPSGAVSLATPIEETETLVAKHYDEVALTVDSPVSVSFGGGVANAHVIILKAIGGKVSARLTSTDGATQSVPVDSLLILLADTVPVTAIDLTRVTGQATTVQVFLGQHG